MWLLIFWGWTSHPISLFSPKFAAKYWDSKRFELTSLAWLDGSSSNMSNQVVKIASWIQTQICFFGYEWTDHSPIKKLYPRWNVTIYNSHFIICKVFCLWIMHVLMAQCTNFITLNYSTNVLYACVNLSKRVLLLPSLNKMSLLKLIDS